MTQNKIWFHIAANCGGCAGIGDMWRALDAAGIPFAVYAANDAGKLAEASRYPGATLIYRDVEASTVNPADYGRDPDAVAAVYWARTLNARPPEIRALGGRVWLELLNEPGREPEQAAWVGRVMAGMARLALAAGLRVCGPGWAPGNPEPDAWTTAGWRDYLGLCAAHPERVAVSLHEYALELDIRAGEAPDGSRWLVGRYEHLHAAVDAMQIARPTVFITECGWTLDDMPAGERAREDIKWLAALYGRHANVGAVFLWTLQSGAGNGDLPARLNALMPWLTGYAINPQPPFHLEPYDPPGSQPPLGGEPIPANVLDNGDFEGGWHHPGNVPELQIPAGWEFKWRDGNEPGWANPFDAAAHSRFMRPEVRTLPAAQLPEPERPVFIRDGKQTLKVFKGSGAWYATLMQTARGLVAGTRYLLKTPVWPDVVMRYENGRKVFADDARACLWRARVGATVVGGPGDHGAFGGGWRSLTPGKWNEPAVEFTATGDTADVKIDLLLPFPLPQNGVFADGWTLTAAVPSTAEPPPQPPPSRPVKVVDISKWQGAINVERLKAVGVDGVMVRASYGGPNGSRADERVDEYVPLLKAAGIPFGLYHYFHPARTVDEQYIAFSEVVKRHGYGLRLALDLEETTGLNNLTPEHARQFAARMAADFPIRDAGKAHLIYTSLGYWRDRLGRPAWGADYELWIAAWTAAAKPTVPAPWTRWTLWQWSPEGDGPAHGVSSSRIDLNKFNGDAAFFAAWAAGATQPPPAPEPPLATALWADAGPRPVYLWNPAFALAGAAVADGLVPVSAEFGLFHGGKNYTYQIALSGDRKTRRVYYAETGKWDAVKWTDGTATEPVPPPPAPVPPEYIDLAAYLAGDGRVHVLEYDIAGHRGHQRMHTRRGNGRWYQVKSGEWEEMWADDSHICRGADTSPGGGLYYVQRENPLTYGAPWCGRYGRPGDMWERNPLVTFYRKNDCGKVDSPAEGYHRTWLRFAARHVTWTSRGGVTLPDVIELHWLLKPTAATPAETYFYARSYGLVGWSSSNGWSSWIVPGGEGQEPPEMEQISCLKR